MPRHNKREGKTEKRVGGHGAAGTVNVNTKANHDASFDAKSTKNHKNNSADHAHHHPPLTGNFLS